MNLIDGVRETDRGVNEEWERREEWRRRKMRAELLIRSVIALRNAGEYRYMDIDIYTIEQRACKCLHLTNNYCFISSQIVQE